jgi:hypothetical protein
MSWVHSWPQAWVVMTAIAGLTVIVCFRIWNR